MKVSLLSLVIAAYTGNHYAPQFNEQLDDYKKSSACIKKLTDAGHARINIEVNGPKCELKGK